MESSSHIRQFITRIMPKLFNPATLEPKIVMSLLKEADTRNRLITVATEILPNTVWKILPLPTIPGYILSFDPRRVQKYYETFSPSPLAQVMAPGGYRPKVHDPIEVVLTQYKAVAITHDGTNFKIFTGTDEDRRFIHDRDQPILWQDPLDLEQNVATAVDRLRTSPVP